MSTENRTFIAGMHSRNSTLAVGAAVAQPVTAKVYIFLLCYKKGKLLLLVSLYYYYINISVPLLSIIY